MLPRASWISAALFALTSAALFGFLGCSTTRTIPVTNAQSKILAPSFHAQQARKQAGLAPIPQSKLAVAKTKSPKLNLKNQIKHTTTTSAQGATLNAAQ